MEKVLKEIRPQLFPDEKVIKTLAVADGFGGVSNLMYLVPWARKDSDEHIVVTDRRLFLIDKSVPLNKKVNSYPLSNVTKAEFAKTSWLPALVMLAIFVGALLIVKVVGFASLKAEFSDTIGRDVGPLLAGLVILVCWVMLAGGALFLVLFAVQQVIPESSGFRLLSGLRIEIRGCEPLEIGGSPSDLRECKEALDKLLSR